MQTLFCPTAGATYFETPQESGGQFCKGQAPNPIYSFEVSSRIHLSVFVRYHHRSTIRRSKHLSKNISRANEQPNFGGKKLRNVSRFSTAPFSRSLETTALSTAAEDLQDAGIIRDNPVHKLRSVGWVLAMVLVWVLAPIS